RAHDASGLRGAALAVGRPQHRDVRARGPRLRHGVDHVPAVRRPGLTAFGDDYRRARGTMNRREELRAWFEEQAPGFRALEEAFPDHLGGALREARLDDARLETRTKNVDSFLDKATKSDGRGGFKYADPRAQLTDFVGGRVMVPLSADVAPVARLVQRLYVV